MGSTTSQRTNGRPPEPGVTSRPGEASIRAMTRDGVPRIRAAEIVLPGGDLENTSEFFTERLGFRVDSVFPADRPQVIVVSGHGVRIRLERGEDRSEGRLRLSCNDPAAIAGGTTQLTAPNGTRVELVAADPPLVLPPAVQSFVLTRSADTAWGVGRAGMRYRDLIPNRQGGRFIASHIHIPDGGPVPDYVHFHKIRFQMIYCYKGWVKVAYEDQGPPLTMQAGDCVLQPPQIRHRVLECSPGLEVIEIGCPAEHETCADEEMDLPTPELRPERKFGGQRFVHHVAATARWGPWRLPGFEFRDTGIAEATDGLVGARVVRPVASPSVDPQRVDGEFHFVFILRGSVSLHCEGAEKLEAGDCFVLPAQTTHSLAECSGDLEFLEVTLPA